MQIHNPALEALEPLVGTWRVEISNAEFLDDGRTWQHDFDLNNLRG